MSLTIEEIVSIATNEKEDWQRKVNQGVLKGDLNQSIAALGGMEAVDKFLFSLRSRVAPPGSFYHVEKHDKTRRLRTVSK